MLNRLKGFLYDCIGLLARSGRREQGPRKLLIVRVDEIGDYILWRNFLEEWILSQGFKEYEIHLCGNSSWKSLFEAFDKSFVQHTHWLEKVRFKKDMKYRYRFLRNIYRHGFSVVINPTFSRDKRNDDAIVRAAASTRNLGMVSNQESIHDYESGYDKGLYTALFDHPQKPLFEFYRNRLFSEFVTGEVPHVENTIVPAEKLPVVTLNLPEKYFVVFPGSRSKARIWPAEYFAEVSGWLFERFGWTAVICGGKDDREYADAFLQAYTFPVKDITAQTSLPELLSVLKNAQCLLSVDTGSVHLAAAAGCTVFGVYNGSQYGRFAPYPEVLAPNFYAVYPDIIEPELADPALVSTKYEFVIDVPYRLVSPGKMINQLKKHYNS